MVVDGKELDSESYALAQGMLSCHPPSPSQSVIANLARFAKPQRTQILAKLIGTGRTVCLAATSPQA